VLIVQSNPFNDSRIATIAVAIIMSNLALADAPGNVRIGKSESGLSKPSVVNVSQVMTIDRVLLSKRVKLLSSERLNRVDEGLRLALGL
jgi:mRNA interferase MazF